MSKPIEVLSRWNTGSGGSRKRDISASEALGDGPDLDDQEDPQEVQAGAPSGQGAAAARVQPALGVGSDRQHHGQGGQEPERHQRKAADAEHQVSELEREAG